MSKYATRQFILRYLESFFQAVENWTTYSDIMVINNRLYLLELLASLLIDNSEYKSKKYIIKVVDSQRKALLELPKSEATVDYSDEDADKALIQSLSIKISQKYTYSNLFNSGFKYFQDNLLARYLSNDAKSRETSFLQCVISTISLILRLPEQMGLCKLELKPSDSKLSFKIKGENNAYYYSPSGLSSTARDVLLSIVVIKLRPIILENALSKMVLMEINHSPFTTKENTPIKSFTEAITLRLNKCTKRDSQQEFSHHNHNHKRSRYIDLTPTTSSSCTTTESSPLEEHLPPVIWNASHRTVGVRIADNRVQHQAEGWREGVVKLYGMQIDRGCKWVYSYCVQWADSLGSDDLEVINEVEFDTMSRYYNQYYKWMSDAQIHLLIGHKVAKWFFTEDESYKKMKLFEGVIAKYSPGHGDGINLYHVEWSDGDREDLTVKEIFEAIATHHQYFTVMSGTTTVIPHATST